MNPLSFLRGFISFPIQFAVVALAAAVGGFIYGNMVASDAARVAALEAEILILKTDNLIQAAAEKDARSKADALDRRSQELAKKVTDYEAELAKRKAPQCLLSPDDARRLRNIR
jgi:ATP-dependent protease ClpP protease subunit